jgi:hypothetical protein
MASAILNPASPMCDFVSDCGCSASKLKEGLRHQATHPHGTPINQSDKEVKFFWGGGGELRLNLDVKIGDLFLLYACMAKAIDGGATHRRNTYKAGKNS